MISLVHRLCPPADTPPLYPRSGATPKSSRPPCLNRQLSIPPPPGATCCSAPFGAGNSLISAPSAGTVGSLDVAGVYHQPFDQGHPSSNSPAHTPGPASGRSGGGCSSSLRSPGANERRCAEPSKRRDKPPVVMGRPTSLACSPGQVQPQPLPNTVCISWRRCAAVILPTFHTLPVTGNLPPSHCFGHPLVLNQTWNGSDKGDAIWSWRLFDTGFGPAQAGLCPRHFRSFRPHLFAVAGVVGPDLIHGDLPAL